MTETSQRERSKAKRRIAIQRAAMRLFAERGYDGATLADIAEAAEVAPRTVSMYFPSKLDIAMSNTSDIAARLLAIFTENPELPFLDVLDRWLAGEVESADPELAGLTRDMFTANPALRAVSTTRVAELTTLAGPAFEAEVGLDSADPMLPVVTAALGAIIGEYLVSAPKAADTAAFHQSFMEYLRSILHTARPA